MQTARGALKLFVSCAEVSEKSITALRSSALTLIVTLMHAPLSSGKVNCPSRSLVITRRTDSSALSCTWPM